MKPHFYSRLVVERVLGRDVWILTAPLKFYSAAIRRSVVVPVGFHTDFASIPRALWTLLPKNGIYDAAAVVHDFGYRGFLSRAVTDAVFYEAMRVLGVPRWKALLMYAAVRLFGWMAYRRRTKGLNKCNLKLPQ